MHVMIAGGAGCGGQLRTEYGANLGHEVTVLSRSPVKNAGRAQRLTWDGCQLGDWAQAIEGADALVNLALFFHHPRVGSSPTLSFARIN